MKYTIKHKITGKTLFECDADSLALAIGQAIGANCDLSYADLRGSDLRGADLREADLSYANLRYANLRYANLREANLSYADLREADLSYANLRGANLREANLRRADLRRADLREANLDFASWPLWCGSIGVKVDLRLAAQLAYHLAAVDCDDPEFLAVRPHLLSLANKSHVVTVRGLPKLSCDHEAKGDKAAMKGEK